MSLLNIFKPKRQQIVMVQSTQMRLETWCASPDLVKIARKLLELPELQTMISVLRNESPSSYGLSMGASHDDHLAHAYKNEGYFMAINTLERMGELVKVKGILEATFEAEPPRQNPLQPQYSQDDGPPVNQL